MGKLNSYSCSFIWGPHSEAVVLPCSGTHLTYEETNRSYSPLDTSVLSNGKVALHRVDDNGFDLRLDSRFSGSK